MTFRLSRRRPSRCNRRDAAAAGAALLALATARGVGAQSASGAFRDLPPCKRAARVDGWDVLAFAGVYGVRFTSADLATFGYESEEVASLDIGRGAKEALLADPDLALKAAQALVLEVRSGAETRRIDVDLAGVLADDVLRFYAEYFEDPALERPEWTAWLLAAAQSGAPLEMALLAGDEAQEVGRATIRMESFSAAYEKARELSDALVEESRLLKCDRTKKVVCSAMNQAYGFGAFRNAVWLRYSARMTPEHERGYHALALPMIAYAYGCGSAWSAPARRALRRALEHMARERTADIWAEMRGGRRRALGRLYRAVLEPLCLCVGRALGARRSPREPSGAARI